METRTKAAERLIVAADFELKQHSKGNINWARKEVLTLADDLAGTGVYLKINSVLRACGYDLINAIHERDLKVFADLKLVDISNTLSTDGIFLQEAAPDLLTVFCGTGVQSMIALRRTLPNTEVLGVTILTSMNDEECLEMYRCVTPVAVERYARWALKAQIGGVVSSAKEIALVRKVIGQPMTINTPAIRPEWAIVASDDQNPDRVMTPMRAIQAGADRIVIGRPIMHAEDRLDAVMRTIEEIENGLNAKEIA